MGCLTAVSPKSHGVRWRGGVERGAMRLAGVRF